MKRREFLPGILAAVVGTQLPFRALAQEAKPALPNPESADFWQEVRAQFRTGEIINLNNGGISPHPLPVEEAFFNLHRVLNDAPSFHKRAIEFTRDTIRQKLADVAGCTADEISTNRNTTEALVTVIMNIPLKRGDEVVLSVFDYPSMMNAWKQRAQKEGLKLRWVNPELYGSDDAAVANAYISLFNGKTRVVHITHMINWTGRIIPAKPIIAAARAREIATIVDAAHTFAHLPFSITELGCDYLASSLHKWLCAPFGNGMLYVKKDKIKGLPSIYPTEPSLWGSIKKYEEVGTHNIASEFAIREAVDFHNLIGCQRKYDRLVELRNHWIDQVKQHPDIKIHTPLGPQQAGAIALVEIKGKTHQETDSYLMNTYGIHSIGIDHEGVTGTRISPHIYTQKEELDLLARALLEMAG